MRWDTSRKWKQINFEVWSQIPVFIQYDFSNWWDIVTSIWNIFCKENHPRNRYFLRQLTPSPKLRSGQELLPDHQQCRDRHLQKWLRDKPIHCLVWILICLLTAWLLIYTIILECFPKVCKKEGRLSHTQSIRKGYISVPRHCSALVIPGKDTFPLWTQGKPVQVPG